jgi:hypothetical protein
MCPDFPPSNDRRPDNADREPPHAGPADDEDAPFASDEELAALLAEDEDDPSLEEDFPMGDGVADLSAEVYCPYCGEPVEIALDPGSGNEQHYIEDCQVCCQPWRVSVYYDEEGHADVQVSAEDEST